MKVWLFFILGCCAFGMMRKTLDARVAVGLAGAAALVALLYFFVNSLI